MDAVLHEVLLAEVIAGIILIQLLQRLLQLVPGWAGKTGTAKKLSAQQVPIVLQEGQVEVTEELHVLVLHPQLLGRVPVDHLEI